MTACPITALRVVLSNIITRCALQAVSNAPEFLGGFRQVNVLLHLFYGAKFEAAGLALPAAGYVVTFRTIARVCHTRIVVVAFGALQALVSLLSHCA